MTTSISVGILGATGAVGQRLIWLLRDHPIFRVTHLYASERSAGKAYGDAVTWRMPDPIPEHCVNLTVAPCVPDNPPPLVFSALPRESAETAEPAFAKAGVCVVSNASAYRMDPLVPLIVPEINADHTGLLAAQREKYGWSGLIVTNPNCATLGLVLPLKALDDAYGVEKVMVSTMQARSGAGFPGPPESEIGDNVLPHIGGEEDKLETEPQKIMGRLDGAQIEMAPMTLSASCFRVDVSDGHLESVSIGLKKKPTDMAEVAKVLREYRGAEAARGLHMTPEQPIVVFDEQERPQPKRDRMAGNGMAVTVGKLRPCSVLDVKCNVLSHNVIRGAAGAALQNGELLVAQGFVS